MLRLRWRSIIADLKGVLFPSECCFYREIERGFHNLKHGSMAIKYDKTLDSLRGGVACRV